MKKYILLALLLVFSLPLVIQSQSSDLPTIDDLSMDWTAVATDGVCSAGTPYQFFTRASDTSDNLLIYFNGGGACWFGQACDLESEPNIHTPFADADSNNPAFGDGIFNFENEENPFADYDMVFIPYCTGDVFIGGGEREYTYTTEEGDEVTITTYHNGFANTSTVLDWAYNTFDSPESVVVAGSSAGAIGSSFHSGFIAENYADVPVVLLADAAGGYNSPNGFVTTQAWGTESILPDWEHYAGIDMMALNFEDFYIASALHAPNLTISQYNTAYDQVQIDFTGVLGEEPESYDLSSRIFNHYTEIESAVDVFYSYTAGGDVHTILRSPLFYAFEVEGVRFVDWTAGLIAGEAVGDISCTDDVLGCFIPTMEMLMEAAEAEAEAEATEEGED